jgi:hypothetical protein
MSHTLRTLAASAATNLTTLAIAAALATVSLSASASSPTEQVQCTTAPKSAWIGETRIRAIFGEQDYIHIAFKESRTHCYEFYAIHKDGGVVEAYFNPLTGERMKFNRVSGDGRGIRYSSL